MRLLWEHLMLLLMKRDWRSEARNFAAQCLSGGVGLMLLTFACFRLGLNMATTGFAYLILVALVSLMGSFTASVVLSIIAAGLLNYFFSQPLFSLSVEHPQDLFALLAFLTTSIVVTGLTDKVRKVAEEAQSSQKALINTIPALVWSALPDGSRDFYSQRWLEFTGLSAEEARTKGWAAAVYPEDQAAVADKWSSAVTTGEPFEVEARGRSAHGDYRWFLIRAEPLRNESGSIVKWYGSNTDIEDRKRATEALRRSEAQWREVFEHNPVMYFMVDATGTVLSVNAFGATQLGYTVPELIGQSVLKAFFQEDQDFVLKNVAVCLETLGQPHSWEVRKVRKSGTVLWVRENAKAVRRSDNQVIVLIACEDITERKRTEEELHRAQAQLRHVARVTTLGELSASIAHEVNQPLTGVVSSGNACLNWLASEPPNIEKARQSVDRIIREANRASEVVGRVRNLAKKAPLQKVWLDINHMIQETIVLTRREIDQSRVSMRTQFSSDLPLVWADRIQLQQVTLNLIINAVEAMNTLDDESRDLFICTGKNEFNDVLLTVQDSGPGLDPRELEIIFEAFYSTKREGMGMGLAVSRSIIEGHGGRLWATPNVSRGATFQFTLPTGQEEAS
jgi:PAS domain S-box-containing protein